MLSKLDTYEATAARSCGRLEMPVLLAMQRKRKKFYHHSFHHSQFSLQQVVIGQASNNVKVLPNKVCVEPASFLFLQRFFLNLIDLFLGNFLEQITPVSSRDNQIEFLKFWMQTFSIC